MTVTMDAGNGHNHSNVRFAVWSSVNGQDDLTWYTAKKNSSGQWTYTVPLVNHNSTGTYFIHAYSSDSGQNRLIGNTTAQVAKLPAPDTVIHFSDIMLHIILIAGNSAGFEFR